MEMMIDDSQKQDKQIREGALNRPSESVKKVASATPPNNDHNERTYSLGRHLDDFSVNFLASTKEARICASQNGTIEWSFSESPEQLARNLRIARAYRVKIKESLKKRFERDDQLYTEQAELKSIIKQRRKVKRTATQTANANRELWSSEEDMRTTLSQITSEATKKRLIKEQLSSIKQRFNAQEIKFNKQQSVSQLESLLIQKINQYVIPANNVTVHPPASSASSSTSSSSSSINKPPPSSSSPSSSSSSSSSVQLRSNQSTSKSKVPREQQKQDEVCVHHLSSRSCVVTIFVLVCIRR
jgi:hypothetical protein